MKNLKTGIITGEITIGNAFVYRPASVEPSSVEFMGAEAETEAFRSALEAVKDELSVLAASEDIFAAHYEMADDPMLEEQAIMFIEEGMDAYSAIKSTSEALCAMFDEIDDEYLKARKDDVKDVCRRIADKISGKCDDDGFAGLEAGSIIVAEELAPSDTTKMDFSRICGFITEKGSTTSHVCIIARSKGLQAMVGIAGCTSEIMTGDCLIMDGMNGIVIVNPDEDTLDRYRALAEEAAGKEYDPSREVYTADGERIWILGNAGNADDVRAAVECGAEGIGLFRSEFLYMESRDFPDEEKQYKAYAEAAEICGERPLTIRTLDIGGDKALPYLDLEKEENPFLGYRAIRISLDMMPQFKTQIRAILRAGAHGNVRMMFPMIATIEELIKARKLVSECMEELEAEGKTFDKEMPVGMMIETPASVLLADEFAEMADFFSIGTNDLTQYIMAADRGNSKVASLYDPASEAVTKAIRMVILAAGRAGIEVSMCGEYASEPSATSLLLDHGLRKFSVSAPAIRRLKSL